MQPDKTLKTLLSVQPREEGGVTLYATWGEAGSYELCRFPDMYRWAWDLGEAATESLRYMLWCNHAAGPPLSLTVNPAGPLHFLKLVPDPDRKRGFWLAFEAPGFDLEDSETGYLADALLIRWDQSSKLARLVNGASRWWQGDEDLPDFLELPPQIGSPSYFWGEDPEDPFVSAPLVSYCGRATKLRPGDFFATAYPLEAERDRVSSGDVLLERLLAGPGATD